MRIYKLESYIEYDKPIETPHGYEERYLKEWHIKADSVIEAKRILKKMTGILIKNIHFSGISYGLKMIKADNE